MILKAAWVDLKNQNKYCEIWRYVSRKIGITQRFNFEDIKHSRQSSMVEVKESIYLEALLSQLNFILRIWSSIKVFTDLYCLLLTFMVDLALVIFHYHLVRWCKLQINAVGESPEFMWVDIGKVIQEKKRSTHRDS